VRNKTGSTRLGFAVRLKFFELEARFPASPDGIPIEAVVLAAYESTTVGQPVQLFHRRLL
jgi:hypothetical protein